MLEFFANNSLARLSILALVFAATLVGAVYMLNVVSRRLNIRQELRVLGDSWAETPHGSLTARKDTAWSRLADRIEKTGLNLSDTKGDELRDKLIAAGYESPAAPRIFTLIRLVMIFALPGIYLLLQLNSPEPPSVFKLYLYGAGLALLGLYVPNLFISAKADRRREEIRNGFPDCLDLILICIEAGLGLEAALDRVGREMVEAHPLVARLLSTTTLQLRAGAPRDAALRRMGEMSGVEEVRSFTTLLIQSDKLGTSIATTLRVYAAEMREKRRLRAEEKAHRLPVVISIPLVVCMLPTMIGVLMLPGIVRVIRVLMPALGGG
jgi:tight adherence protein C